MRNDIKKLTPMQAIQYIEVIQTHLPVTVRMAYIYAVTKSKAVEAQTRQYWNAKYKPIFEQHQNIYPGLVGEGIIAASHMHATEKIRPC
tara:strand:+ start:1280 stop:1546 length:267 start_codon:yes stop_codon:yes gene_type:complete